MSTLLPAVVILGLWGLSALFAPLLPLQPDHIDLQQILAGPGPGSWLGSDDLGRPLLDRLLMGARTSFSVALGVVLISSLLGTLLGTFAAYTGGAGMLQGIWRVTFWGALAMAITAGVGLLFGAVG